MHPLPVDKRPIPAQVLNGPRLLQHLGSLTTNYSLGVLARKLTDSVVPPLTRTNESADLTPAKTSPLAEPQVQPVRKTTAVAVRCKRAVSRCEL